MSMRNTAVIALLCCSTLSFGCFGGAKKDVVATVGSTKITNAQLQERINTFPAEYQASLQTPENKARILDQMIDEQVFLEAAKKAGYSKKKEFRDQLEATERQLLMNAILQEKVNQGLDVTQEEMRAYFNNNPAQFSEAEQRRLSHILVATKEEAEDILSRIGKGADFAELAKAHSKDATAQSGGNLGFVQKGQLVPEFESAAFTISRSGQTSGVVQTQFGYHIIRLDEVRQRPKLAFEAVADQIRQVLLNEKQRTKMSEALTELKEKVKVSRKVENIK